MANIGGDGTWLARLREGEPPECLAGSRHFEPVADAGTPLPELEPMRPKALLFANTDWYLFNFRRSLAEAIADAGWEVVLVSPPGEYGPQLRELGFDWVPFDFSAGSINPVREASVVMRLARLYRRQGPALAHHFTVKCVIYGSLAARLIPRTAVVNAVTGAGYIFSDRDRTARILRHPVEWGYRVALSRGNSRVIFQNEADRDSFLGHRLVDRDRARVIRGSGVDCDRFRPPATEEDRAQEEVRVLLATRLLRDKGVFEYARAAEDLKDRFPASEFLMAGLLYPANPASISREELDAIIDRGAVRYLGHVEDMPELLRSVDVVVLPTSYVEGTPRILIEAAACARPVVATDIPACRGLVEDGRNGFLIPRKDAKALAEALERLFADGELRRRFGRAGREVVLSGFEQGIVVRRTFDVYRELVPEFPGSRSE